ncbi:MAG: BNR-4 repeat-containing protein, partial [Thermoguttaceae bacterium]|nr:BNR-4 repeat-containing protein [Thermoguttaceae bacterium]
MKHPFIIVVALIAALCQIQIQAADPAPWKVVSRENIASVWSGNPVGFAFVQKEGQIYIGFYSGEDKSMVIGQKQLPDGEWKFKKLDTKIGWDSHNYITIAFDRDNCLHVCGNM